MLEVPIVESCCCFNLDSGGRVTGFLGVIYGFMSIIADLAILIGYSVRECTEVILMLNLLKNCKIFIN